MAKSVAVSLIIDRTLRMADREGSAYVTRAHVLDLIDSSYGEFYEQLYDAGLISFEAVANLSPVSGAIALPGGFMKELAMHYVTGNTIFPLRKIEITSVHLFPTNQVQYSSAFRIAGNNVLFYSIPPNGQTYTLYYLPNPVLISTEGQTLDFVSGWEQLLVLDVAIQIKTKANEDFSGLLILKEKMLKRMEKIIAERRAAMAMREEQLVGDPLNGQGVAYGDEAFKARMIY
jgi:hypothetical protein